MMSEQLSPNFSLAELTFSEIALRQGFDNEVPASLMPNLIRLATTLLEPARARLRVPFHINSGYRSPDINAAIGGSRNSAHMECCAADIKPLGIDLLAAFHDLRVADELPYDQLILECGPTGWIHIAIALAGQTPRREALLANGRPGNWHYERVV
jgi:zinc D-Ala-D-Ala carboxypeptidase